MSEITDLVAALTRLLNQHNATTPSFAVPTARFQPLDNTNWHAWQIEMRAHLVLLDLWTVVEIPEGATRNDEFTNKDKVAKKQIINNCSTSAKMTIEHCASAEEMFERLRIEYEGSGIQRTANLIRNLFHLNSCTSVSSLANVAESLINRIEPALKKDRTAVYLSAVLSALDDKSDHIKRRLTGETDMDHKRMINILREYSHCDHSVEQSWFTGQGGSVPSQLNAIDHKSDSFCLVCGLNNHSTENCRYRKRQARQKTEKKAKDASPSDGQQDSRDQDKHHTASKENGKRLAFV